MVRGDFIEAYVFSVTLIESRALLWTVHTEHGAIYSRLPTKAICLEKVPPLVNFIYDEWGAISSNGQVISHEYLKDYAVKLLIGSGHVGVYQFTIDYFGGGFSEDPEQHKTSNVIFLDSGHIYVGPNNKMLFMDKHFVSGSSFQYRRNSKYHYLD
jgi:hypothetical protein